MKNSKKYICFLSVLILFFSCQKKVVFDIDYKEQPVLNCLFSADSTVDVFLTTSVSPTDITYFEAIENADIYLYRNNKMLGMLNEMKETSYTIDLYSAEQIKKSYTNKNIKIRDVAGDVYKIVAILPNMDTCEAITQMPEKPILQSLELIDCSLEKNTVLGNMITGYGISGNIKVNIRKNENFKYYGIKVSYDANITEHTLEETDTIYKTYLPLEIKSPGFQITYLKGNGYIFSDSCFINDELEFIISVENTLRTNDPNVYNKLFVEVSCISEDYYYYEKEMIEQFTSQSDAFSNIKNVHSNIKNGLGIFACYTTLVDTLYLPEVQKY